MFDPRLPWGISCAACAVLAFTSSSQANSYQASIDTDLYQQSGDLRVAWMKPVDGVVGNGLSLLAAVCSAASLYQILNSKKSVAAAAEPAEAKTQAKSTSTQSQSTTAKDEIGHADRLQGDTPKPELTQSTAEIAPPSLPNPTVPDLYDRVWNHKKRHLLIPAETGAGKTTLLLGLIKYFWTASNQTLEVYASTTKPSPCLGLEFETAPDGRPRVINLDVTKPHSIKPLIERLRWLQRRMQERQNQRADAEATGKPYTPHRIIIVADEWNSTLALAKRLDKVLARDFAIAKAEKRQPLPPAPYAVDELQALMESILLMGREDECAEWVFGQDHQVQNAGFNTGYQKSFGIIVPFRKGASQALEQALIGRSPVLPMSTGKQILQQGYEAMEEKPSSTFVYSNLNGHEIIEMPYLPTIKREKLYGERQQPTAATTAAATETTVESESKDPWEE